MVLQHLGSLVVPSVHMVCWQLTLKTQCVCVAREVSMPFIIVLNMSNDGYFLPPNKVETKDQLLKFIDGVLKGRIKVSLN